MKKLLILIFISIVGLVLITTKQKDVCDHCNILLIDIDTLRQDSLPCYGYSRNTAPNICSWAKDSLVFNDNYSVSNWTLPDIFSTITSQYPSFHKVRTEFVDRLSDRIPTLAETLQKNGYTTIFIGDKNNPASINPNNGGLRGYDQIINIKEKTVESVIESLRNEKKPWFIHVYEGGLHLPYLISEDTKPIEETARPSGFPVNFTEFDRQLNKYLKKNYKNVFQEKAIREYKDVILSPAGENDTRMVKLFNSLLGKQEEYLKDAWNPRFNTYMESFDKNNPADVAYVRMMYDTRISQIDKQTGNILEKIKTSPKTITILMSDHGEAFGKYGTFTHEDNSHTELYKTPLIINIPKFGQKTIKQTTSNVDIFPTLLDVVNLKIVDGLQGQSLKPVILNKVQKSDRLVISEGINGTIWQNEKWLFVLPNAAKTFDQSKLFDKLNDPEEKDDVKSKYVDLSSTLFEKAKILQSYSNLETEKHPDEKLIKLSPEKIKRLQKEGYF